MRHLKGNSQDASLLLSVYSVGWLIPLFASSLPRSVRVILQDINLDLIRAPSSLQHAICLDLQHSHSISLPNDRSLSSFIVDHQKHWETYLISWSSYLVVTNSHWKSITKNSNSIWGHLFSLLILWKCPLVLIATNREYLVTVLWALSFVVGL